MKIMLPKKHESFMESERGFLTVCVCIAVVIVFVTCKYWSLTNIAYAAGAYIETVLAAIPALLLTLLLFVAAYVVIILPLLLSQAEEDCEEE